MPNTPPTENLSVEEVPALEATLVRGTYLMRFPSGQEVLFRRYYLQRNRHRMLVTLVLGILFFLAFVWVDPHVMTDATMARLLRLGIVLPVGVAVLAGLTVTRQERLAQWLYTAALLVAGLVLLAISGQMHGRAADIYLASVVIILMYGYVFSGLRVPYALGTGIVVTAVTVGILYLNRNLGAILSGTWLATLLAANIIGAYGCVLIETCIRQDFLRSRLLAARQIQLQINNEQLLALTTRDELTGLINRRGLRERIANEWERCARDGKPLTLILIDVDAFKAYNDALGHQQGDRCLERVARVIEKWARRPGDTASRFGGEEFAVMLSDCPADAGRDLANSLRREIETLGIPHPASPLSDWVTASLGVGTRIPGPDSSLEAFFEAVDQALYAAKSAGRNRVESLSEAA